MEVSGLVHVPAALPEQKELLVPIEYGARWNSELCRDFEKNRCLLSL
jgi:hypothetical protein